MLDRPYPFLLRSPSPSWGITNTSPFNHSLHLLLLIRLYGSSAVVTSKYQIGSIRPTRLCIRQYLQTELECQNVQPPSQTSPHAQPTFGLVRCQTAIESGLITPSSLDRDWLVPVQSRVRTMWSCRYNLYLARTTKKVRLDGPDSSFRSFRCRGYVLNGQNCRGMGCFGCTPQVALWQEQSFGMRLPSSTHDVPFLWFLVFSELCLIYTGLQRMCNVLNLRQLIAQNPSTRDGGEKTYNKSKSNLRIPTNNSIGVRQKVTLKVSKIDSMMPNHYSSNSSHMSQQKIYNPQPPY